MQQLHSKELWWMNILGKILYKRCSLRQQPCHSWAVKSANLPSGTSLKCTQRTRNSWSNSVSTLWPDQPMRGPTARSLWWKFTPTPPTTPDNTKSMKRCIPKMRSCRISMWLKASIRWVFTLCAGTSQQRACSTSSSISSKCPKSAANTTCSACFNACAKLRTNSSTYTTIFTSKICSFPWPRNPSWLGGGLPSQKKQSVRSSSSARVSSPRCLLGSHPPRYKPTRASTSMRNNGTYMSKDQLSRTYHRVV